MSVMAHKRHLESRLDGLVTMKDRHIAWIKAFSHVECLSGSDVLDIGQRLAFLYAETALVRTLEEQIDRVCKALQRAKEGTDGQCEDCGGAIPDERRGILPEATRCVLCQERWEKLGTFAKQTLGFLPTGP